METGLLPCLILWVQFVLLVLPIEGQIQFPGGGGGGGGFNRPRPNFPQSPRPLPPKQQQKEPQGCNCLSKTECPSGFGQHQVACVTENGNPGICCFPQTGTITSRVGFSSSDVDMPNIPPNIISNGIQMGIKFFGEIQQNERDRLRKHEYLARGEPARGHAYFFQRTPSSQSINDLAYTLAQSSVEIARLQSLSAEQSFFGLPTVRVQPRDMNVQCPLVNPRCDAGSKYRTIDGSCNNLQKPLWGRSETALARIQPALYSDGILAPKETGVDGSPLPNVRTVSSTILIDVDSPDRDLTLNVMQFAQFMDHDLTLVPFDDMNGEAIRCCEDGRLVSPMPQSCFPIIIPPNDAFYGPRGQGCINFVRSMLALNENCGLGPVEQQNVLTHFIDGSMIYGSTEDGVQGVADLSTGFMRTSPNNLPPTNRSLDCEARVPGSLCFVGGDTRISEQPALTTMHTIWVREHNRIATILRRLNPRWNARKLFEETRRIVIAQVQQITYREWLPIVIGPDLMNKLGINVLQSGFRRTYDPTVDPRIANEFSAAAFRFGHSLLQGIYRLLTTTGRQTTIRLRDSFNAPHLIQGNPDLIDGFVNALTLQNIQSLDNFITQEVSNHLFQTPRFNFGMDLMSFNFQRARDHAISTYNIMREFFGLGKANTFIDLRSTTNDDLIKRLQSVYKSVHDIDLFAGGMTERSVPGGLLGPTFANIVGRQFQRAQVGDRFFFDTAGQAGSFTEAQLNEIRKGSMARVFCDNSKVAEMQPKAFVAVSTSNPRVACSGNTIPSINLEVFKE